MLNSYFKGNETLFAGLAIPDRHESCPVIYLDFNVLNTTSLEAFQCDLSRALIQTGRSYQIQLDDQKNSPDTLLQQLVYGLSESGKRSHSVVVLVDEYDRPVRESVDLERGLEAEQLSGFLKRFFAQFQSLEPMIKLLLLTCTVRLSLYNDDTGEGLKTLEDLTFDPAFHNMIGLTENELTSHFHAHIDAMANSRPNETFHSLVQTLRKRYDGYCFSRNTSSACRLYNFHLVISCLRTGKMENTWHASYGNTSNYDMIDEFRCGKYVLNEFTKRCITGDYLRTLYDFDWPFPTPLCMILRGYLTFRDYNPEYDEYEVDFPNDEIRETFVKEMMRSLPGGRRSTAEILGHCKKIETTLSARQCEHFVDLFNNIAFDEADKTYDAAEADAKYEFVERISRLLQTCDIYCARDCNYFHDIYIDLYIRIGLPEVIEYLFQFEWRKNAAHALNTLLNYTTIAAFQETFKYNSVYLVGVNFGGPGGTIDEWIRVTHTKGKCSDLKSSHPHYLEMFSRITKTKQCVSRQFKQPEQQSTTF
jgi:hypothetical protein